MTTEELLLRAAENCSIANLNALLENLRSGNAHDLNELAEPFQLLWEAFPEEPEADQAAFCLEMAKLRIPDSPVFRQVLDKFFGGQWDAQTEKLLQESDRLAK